MENAVLDLFSLGEHSNVNGDLCSSKPAYKSLIKVNGKPILPPILSEEKKKEMQIYKQKAIEKEKKLANLKNIFLNKKDKISSDNSSISNVRPSRQSTPTRPATLNIPFTKSRTDGSLDRYTSDESIGEIISSQVRSKSLNRSFKSTLEQKLAFEDSVIFKNKANKCQQSPIIEEQIVEKIMNSDNDSKKERKKWSPLKIDSISSLQIKLPGKETEGCNENPDVSLDESQNTPETVRESPNLMRQNSYTILTPSPALLSFLESNQNVNNKQNQRPNSGRKTWDLNKAKQNWDSTGNKTFKSSDEEGIETKLINKKNSSSVDSFSVLQFDPDGQVNSIHNSLVYDSCTSFDSNSPKSSLKRSNFEKSLETKTFESKSVPFQKSLDKSPCKNIMLKSNDFTYNSMPSDIKNDLTDLSDLLLKMKMDHVRQKKELEEKQQYEMKKLEILFKKKEADLLIKVNQFSKKGPKSIYSQVSRELGPIEFDMRVMGDGNHNRSEREKLTSVSDQCMNQYFQSRRPHSAKDFHPQYYPQERDCSRRARSMDFNQGNQDTDLDVSFQDDFNSKDTTLNNEYVLESDSISNFSSHSSTMSSDNRLNRIPVCSLKKFQGLTSEEYAKYNKAATIITAAARGFLTRRLLRTAHVQGLITTLRDAIKCATQLHGASDIADSDIDLMKRLGRQIEAAWDAVYSVFFNTETSTKLQLIATDRERLRAVTAKTPVTNIKKKRISSATKKFLDRKKGGSVMSKSQPSNGFTRVRTCSKMTASYPRPYYPQKLK